MASTVGVVIGTYGGTEWRRAGQHLTDCVRTMPGVTRVVASHADTLAQARNLGAARLDTDWLIFLDADDQLATTYVTQMLSHFETTGDATGIYRPATQGVYPDGSEDEDAVLIPRRDLTRSNYIVIGAMCRRDVFNEVGGFHEHAALEDFCLWRRMAAAGSEVYDVPGAVYKVYIRPDSRNRDLLAQRKAHAQIMAGCR